MASRSTCPRYWGRPRCSSWIGSASRCVPIRTSPSAGQYPSPAGASGVVIAAFGNSSRQELEARFSQVDWYDKPSFADFLVRVEEARRSGFAVDRDAMFRGVTLVSVPVLSPSWELLLILTAAGHSHDLADEAVGALSRAMQSAAARLSDSLPLLRLG